MVDTDRVRVCIDDVKVHETTVGHGRIAIGGLPSGEALKVTVNGITATASNGQTAPTTLDLNAPWALVAWEVCNQGCTPCSIEKTPTETTETTDLLLAIRFID